MHVNDFVRSYFEAWNQLDPEGVAMHMASEGVYRDMPEDVQRSRDELVVSLEQFFAGYRQHYELIGEIQKSSDTIAFQYRMLFFGDNKSSDPAASYRGAEFITMQGDQALSITDYYDMPTTTHLRKYARSGLSNEQLNSYQKRLDLLMKTQQLYLRPSLTLPELASIVGCTVNHLSQVINAGFGSSFFDYLNQHRVQYAKELMMRNFEENASVLDIAYQVGFNSNSAFYSAFKKFVGQTPASFRRSLQQPSG
jgi:AraC-like DNA-binding protein